MINLFKSRQSNKNLKIITVKNLKLQHSYLYLQCMEIQVNRKNHNKNQDLRKWMKKIIDQTVNPKIH